MPDRGRLVGRRERILFASIGYGTAVVLMLLAFVVGDGDGQRYLFNSALILAAATTGTLLISFRRRRD